MANPNGRPPSEKSFLAALRIAVASPGKNGQPRLRDIAEKLVLKALDGEGWAIQQVADRLDGKPAQETTLTVDDKRSATDWTRAELVTVLNDWAARGAGASEADGRGEQPDRLQ